MEKTIQGSLGAASAFQLTEEMEALDKQSKKILQYKEVLAIILKETVEEYQGYSEAEIMEFIEADSITEAIEVSGGRTNTKIEGAATEFAELDEKTTNFDIAFRAKNPRLSNGKVAVNLYVDVEPQKNYRPGYPIEKRGIYYLARRLCSQLDVVTEKTNYGQLEKCYTIFICRDKIPKREQMSISFYKMVNNKNIGNCHPRKKNYDLMTLVIIRLGDKDYHSEEKNILDFLTIIFQPHQKGFRKKLSRYISFEEELEAEGERHMIGLGMSIYEEGIEKGIKKGIKTGRKQGISQGMKQGMKQGISQGMKQGIERGMEKGLELKRFLLVCKKLAKGKSASEIAEALEEPEDIIQQLCEKAAIYAPDYDEAKIRESWSSL
ncbi:MAG: hypothetical protein NC318_09560 [Blautia sp.]|nr:hypothetical protein [Blautia sp.]